MHWLSYLSVLADASPAPAHTELRVLDSCYIPFLLFYLLIYLVSTLKTHQTWITSLQLCGLSTQCRVWTRLDQLNIFENEVGPCHCICEELYSLRGAVTVSPTRLQGGFWEMAIVTYDLSDNSHKEQRVSSNFRGEEELRNVCHLTHIPAHHIVRAISAGGRAGSQFWLMSCHMLCIPCKPAWST